jgi:hypothetical protein
MTSQTLLSPIEQKLLLNFVLLICFVYFYNLSDKAVFNYNKEVRTSQERMAYQANKPDNGSKLSFGIYDCYSSTPLWYLLYWLQFFTTPLSYLLLKTQKTGRFILSTFFTFLTFLSFTAWLYETFLFHKYLEGDYLKNESFNRYILFDSTFLELALFPLIFFLLFLQLSIIFRFTVEKFQAKIS